MKLIYKSFKRFSQIMFFSENCVIYILKCFESAVSAGKSQRFIKKIPHKLESMKIEFLSEIHLKHFLMKSWNISDRVKFGSSDF